MASDTDKSEDLTDASHGPRECMPCRGSGQVISNLGGAPSRVTCPWCAGSGVRAQGIDAQAGWPTEPEVAAAGGASEPAGGASEPADQVSEPAS